MSNYVGRFFHAVSSALEFNSATLSGAIDVIVVEDDDGHRRCSPFHVRFGKLQLLKSRGIPVSVYINEKKTNLSLRLGTAGEAYFKIPVEDILPAPESTHLVHDSGDKKRPVSQSESISSSSLPVLKPDVDGSRHPWQSRPSHIPSDYMSDTEVEVSRTARDGRTEIVERPSSPPPSTKDRRWDLDTFRLRPSTQMQVHGPGTHQEHTLRVDSLQDLQEDRGPISDENRAKCTSVRDKSSEGEKTRNDSPNLKEISSTESFQTEYLSDSTTDGSLRVVDGYSKLNNVEAKQSGQVEGGLSGIFSRAKHKAHKEDAIERGAQDKRTAMVESSRRERDRREYVESTDGEMAGSDWADGERDSLGFDGEESQSDIYEDSVLAMSLCGDMLEDNMSEEEVAKVFEAQRVTYEQFASYPNILYNSNMMFRVGNRLLDFRVVAPLVMSRLAFGRSPDIDELSVTMKAPFQEKKEVKKEKEAPKAQSRGFSWFGFRSSPTPEVTGPPLIGEEEMEAIDKANREAEEVNEREAQGFLRHDSSPQSITEATLAAGEPQIKVAEGGETEPELPEETDYNFGDVENDYLSLKPTSKQLQELELSPGKNDVRFQVASSTVEVRSRIYLWKSDTKMVISDVDGTITRSDVLGQILPRVGRDWSQAGVAGLYTHIARNGYKFMYLTSRPIGQAAGTRAFLDSVSQQGGFHLPDGPIIMSPDRLMESFTREVIRRKPHEFKIGALRDIRSLFAEDHNVFHAGFGNRDTDVMSYRTSGIPPYRIFTVNPQGELVVMKALYESAGSYTNLRTLVGSVFPDISGKRGKEARRRLLEASAFNDWNFWKADLPELTNDIDLESLM